MKCKSEFDEEAKMYAWAPLGCGNYAPNFFGTSVPEVVEVRENPDGTVTYCHGYLVRKTDGGIIEAMIE